MPDTGKRAQQFLAIRLPDPQPVRLIYAESQPRSLYASPGALAAAVHAVDRLDTISASDLDLADAEVFPRRSLKFEAGDFYARRLARGGRVSGFPSQAFETWGPELAVVLHPWEGAGEPIELEAPMVDPGSRLYASTLPASGGAGTVHSLRILLPLRWVPDDLELTVGDLRLPLV